MKDSDRCVSKNVIKDGDSIETNIVELKDTNEWNDESTISIKEDFLKNNVFNRQLNNCISENIKNNRCSMIKEEDHCNSANYTDSNLNDTKYTVMISNEHSNDKKAGYILNQSEIIKEEFCNNNICNDEIINKGNNKSNNGICYDEINNKGNNNSNNEINNKGSDKISYEEISTSKSIYDIIEKNFNDIKESDDMFINTKEIDDFFSDTKELNVNNSRFVKSSNTENSSVFSESYITLEIMSNIKKRIKIIEKDVYEYLNIDQIETIKTKVRKMLNKQHFQTNRRILKRTDITDCNDF